MGSLNTSANQWIDSGAQRMNDLVEKIVSGLPVAKKDPNDKEAKDKPDEADQAWKTYSEWMEKHKRIFSEGTEDEIRAAQAEYLKQVSGLLGKLASSEKESLSAEGKKSAEELQAMLMEISVHPEGLDGMVYNQETRTEAEKEIEALPTEAQHSALAARNALAILLKLDEKDVPEARKRKVAHIAIERVRDGLGQEYSAAGKEDETIKPRRQQQDPHATLTPPVSSEVLGMRAVVDQAIGGTVGQFPVTSVPTLAGTVAAPNVPYASSTPSSHVLGKV